MYRWLFIDRIYLKKIHREGGAKKVDMHNYIKPTKPGFYSSLYILHVGTNDLSLEDTPEPISKRTIATVENLKKEHSKVAVSNILARGMI